MRTLQCYGDGDRSNITQLNHEMPYIFRNLLMNKKPATINIAIHPVPFTRAFSLFLVTPYTCFEHSRIIRIAVRLESSHVPGVQPMTSSTWLSRIYFQYAARSKGFALTVGASLLALSSLVIWNNICLLYRLNLQYPNNTTPWNAVEMNTNIPHYMFYLIPVFKWCSFALVRVILKYKIIAT